MTSWGIPGRAGQRTALVLAAALTVALAISLGNVAESSAGGTHAVAAKKKCKKKGKKSAVAAKKKCKKKKKVGPVAQPVPGPKPPVVRAEISWSGDADIDLHGWSSGLHAGWNDVDGAFENEIPGTVYESNANSERIIDNTNPSTRGLTFGVCYYPDFETGSAGPTDINVHVVYANGSVDDFIFDNFEESDFSVDPSEEGGSADPVDDWCPEEV
jgi:hypothetical protein